VGQVILVLRIISGLTIPSLRDMCRRVILSLPWGSCALILGLIVHSLGMPKRLGLLSPILRPRAFPTCGPTVWRHYVISYYHYPSLLHQMCIFKSCQSMQDPILLALCNTHHVCSLRSPFFIRGEVSHTIHN